MVERGINNLIDGLHINMRQQLFGNGHKMSICVLYIAFKFTDAWLYYP